MAEFDSALNAVTSAIEIQTTLKSENQRLPIARRMSFRVGISLGDIIQKDDRIYGNSVNIAARIQQVADPDGICISRGIYDQVKKKLDGCVKAIGPYSIKKIPDPVMIYRICLPSEDRHKRDARLKALPSRKDKIIRFVCLVIPVIGLLWALQTVYRLHTTPSIEKSSIHGLGRETIDVLPFDHLNGDPRQKLLCDGIFEQIIASLLSLPCVYVVATHDPLLAAINPSADSHDQSNGARYALRGSVQCIESRVRISIRVVDLNTARYVWAKTFDRQMTDLFSLQDEIAITTITTLQRKIFLSMGGKNDPYSESNPMNLLFDEDGLGIE
jgi:TolB-like protein